MKKRVIAIVLFLFCGLILSGSLFSRNEETIENNVRNIVLEDNKLDLSYYENKYDIYNEEKTCFEIAESFQSSNRALGKNSNGNELEVAFYLYVNKDNQYFIFSYEVIVDEEVVLTSKVKIDFVEYEERYYLVSSNGYVTPYDEVLQEYAIGDCAMTYAYFGDCIGINGLRDYGLLGAGGALGFMAAAAVASSVVNNSGSSVAGSMPPNGNNNNNNNKKKSIKEIIDDIKDEYKQNGQCDKFADELEAGMKENNISGTKLELRTNYKRDFIYSDKANECISTNGKHVGIQIDNMVYDNMNPNGIPYNEWINDLGGEKFFNIFKTLI